VTDAQTLASNLIPGLTVEVSTPAEVERLHGVPPGGVREWVTLETMSHTNDADPPLQDHSNIFMSAMVAAQNRLRLQARFRAAATSYALRGGTAPLLQATGWDPEQELPVMERRIITPQEFRSAPAVIGVDARLLRVLDRQPEQILSLSARQFEEFVAALLERLDYRPSVTPVGRDGGIDIVATRTTPLGPELVLVQCKRYAPDKKVGEPVVKQLCMVVEDQRATRGLIVTTSTFTSVALKYIELKRHKLSGADHAKLQEWMRLVGGGGQP